VGAGDIEFDADELNGAVVGELALHDEGVYQPAARDQDSLVVPSGDEPGQLVPAGREPLDCVEEIRANELCAAGTLRRGACGRAPSMV
jgi:hypothetical protein